MTRPATAHWPSAHKPTAWRWQEGCRHPACHDARLDAWRNSRDAARERAAADPSLIPHGTASGREYWGCGCAACREAARLKQAVSVARRKRSDGLPLTRYDLEVLALSEAS